MKLSVDSATCQAYGICQEEAPALVDLDEFGYSAVLGDGSVQPGQAEAARSAVVGCPAKALRLG
jgi:ferredoxin